MADYLRQLKNDEKRRTFSMVGTINPGSASATTAKMCLFVVPKRATRARIYAVPKEAFAAGATVTFEVYKGDEAGKVLFTTLALDTGIGSVTMGDGDSAGRWATDEYVGATFNQAAVDSAVGEAQIVIEFTEVPVCAGSYSK